MLLLSRLINLINNKSDRETNKLIILIHYFKLLLKWGWFEFASKFMPQK